MFQPNTILGLLNQVILILIGEFAHHLQNLNLFLCQPAHVLGRERLFYVRIAEDVVDGDIENPR